MYLAFRKDMFRFDEQQTN